MNDLHFSNIIIYETSQNVISPLLTNYFSQNLSKINIHGASRNVPFSPLLKNYYSRNLSKCNVLHFSNIIIHETSQILIITEHLILTDFSSAMLSDFFQEDKFYPRENVLYW